MEGGGGPRLIKGRDFFPVQNPPSRTWAGRLCGSGGSAGEPHGSREGCLGRVWGRKPVLLTGGPLPGRGAPSLAGLGLAQLQVEMGGGPPGSRGCAGGCGPSCRLVPRLPRPGWDSRADDLLGPVGAQAVQGVLHCFSGDDTGQTARRSWSAGKAAGVW